ncbi:TRAP transporter substrate-binding protein [Glaciecola sp. 1036]|uniref:TRAP transporter substrate-binding protein n=1 Tax=Alteromonadaceae TaxID=72275 RepID=UPI003D06602F
MKFCIRLFILVSICLLSSCSQENDKQKVIRLAHTLDVNHPVHFAMEYMKQRLEFHSQGKMSMLIYASGQLGSERESLELLQIGSLPMTKVSASSLEAFVPEMKVFSVPYLFSSSDHLWSVLNGEVGQELLQAGTPYLFMGLGYYDAGSRSFYTTEAPVNTPDDLVGKKIRVMNSQSAVNMVNTLGGSATPISWGELYTSLQQGVVDGAENNPPSFYLSKHYEVARYYVLDEHTSIPDILVFSTKVWNSLSSQQQSWLQAAVNDSVVKQRELWEIATQDAIDNVIADGVTVIQADKSHFVEKTESIRDEYRGSAIGQLIKRIQKLDTAKSTTP